MNLIRKKEEDFQAWYDDLIHLGDIAHPGLVKGTVFFLPRGWKLWTRIQTFVNTRFELLGIQNVSFPSLIPLSELIKEEKQLGHISKEILAVGDKNFLRPTSEILFSHCFKKLNKIPICFNQWCNVFRKEKNTRIFLRGVEFFWQELHAIFERSEQAYDFLHKTHNVYKQLVYELLHIHVLCGEKTVGERFSGSECSLSLEAIMPDGQALQIATSHYLGTNFSTAFNVKIQGKLPFQISAGCSTRLLGALIMSHSDNQGLVLPLSFTEIRVLSLVEIPKDYITLLNLNVDVIWDKSDKSFGYKMKECELKGVAFTLIIGKRELANHQVLIKSRIFMDSWGGLETIAPHNEVNQILIKACYEYAQLLKNRNKELVTSFIQQANSLDETITIIKEGKIALVPWFDDVDNESVFKQKGFGFGPRCINKKIDDKTVKCFFSGQAANTLTYFGRSY